jgi:hypothetical protein
MALARMILAWGRSRYNPLTTNRSDLPPPLALIAKLLTLVYVVKGVVFDFPTPFLPFLGFFDALGRDGLSPTLFKTACQLVFAAGLFGVLFSSRTRLACLALGGILLIGILSSKIFYTNGKVFWSCLMLMLGLQGKTHSPWLLQTQRHTLPVDQQSPPSAAAR